MITTINKEKQAIIACKGNVLVTANPGTGKTLLLAYKFVDLLNRGYKPDEILCLTFTNKAKREMEDRIIKIIKEENLIVDLSKLNIFTFHSYCLDNLDDSEIVSSNLIRYAIYRHLKDNETLNYGDEYLVETIVPKMENLMRYLKNFGITPDKININEVKPFIEDTKKFEKADLERFLGEFIKIFAEYEKIKSEKGYDYTDLLLEFLKLKSPPHYRFVLVDELQDVNSLEADIALKSADNFLAVGDAKQAIFGFQGGSILNFKKFSHSTSFVLSENFRSSNEVLNYARKEFVSKTVDEIHTAALKDLKNKEAASSDKPKIISIQKEDSFQAIFTLIKQLLKTNEKVAIVARTNTQIMKISKELEKRDIEHSSTFFSASDEAKDNIITFLQGILSKDMQLVKNSMFTPFFPITLQDAFEIAQKRDLTLEEIYSKSPEFKVLRDSVKTTEDLNILFKEKIIPIALSYGEEYLLASMTMQSACTEAIKFTKEKSVIELVNYLKSADLLSNETNLEKKVILTTVHKAKGKEYDNVIYIPQKPKDNSNFQDYVVEAILKSKGIDAKEELEEETLRVNFVAYTRAKKRLFIITEKPNEFLNEFADMSNIALESDLEGIEDASELKKRAYNLFVNGDFEKAKKALENNEAWLLRYIENHFKSLDRISFSVLTTDPYEYLTDNIIQIKDFSQATSIGTEVHDLAEDLVKGECIECREELKPYIQNVEKILSQLKSQGYSPLDAEHKVLIPLSQIVPTNDALKFKGKIDAVFKNGEEYLIVDWKTDKKTDNASGHRQQLEAYKRIYSESAKVPLKNIKVALAFVGLRKTINDGCIDCEYDDKQPAKTAFDTLSKQINKFLEWRTNPKHFLEELKEVKETDPLIRCVVEQWKIENNKHL